MKNKTITSMELLTLLNRTKQSVHNLTGSEFRILSYLITCSNHSSGDGYKCWPSHSTISAYTGATSRTITTSIKKLSSDGWITYIQGRAQNSSSKYYIEASKIIDFYLMSDSSNRRPDGFVMSTNINSDRQTKAQHQRNTSGLKQNMQKQNQPDIDDINRMLQYSEEDDLPY